MECLKGKQKLSAHIVKIASVSKNIREFRTKSNNNLHKTDRQNIETITQINLYASR